MYVRYYGHAGGRTGYGEAGTALCRSILTTGCTLTIAADGALAGWEGDAALLKGYVELEATPERPDLLVFHYQPHYAGLALDHVLSARPEWADVPRAIYTTYEGASELTDERVLAVLARFHHRWAPTPLVGRPFNGWVPHAFNAKRNRLVRTTPSDTYRFYYRGTMSDRKHVGGLVAAYAHAFKPTDRVTLTLYIRGVTHECLATWLQATGLSRDQIAPIVLVPDDLSPSERDATLANHDCFVTASRGEAWGLSAFEAVLAEKWVISPHGLGSDYFLRGASAELVRSEADLALSVGDRAAGITCRTHWMHVNLSALAVTMRTTAKRRPPAGLMRTFVERFSYEAAGEQFLTAVRTNSPSKGT